MRLDRGALGGEPSEFRLGGARRPAQRRHRSARLRPLAPLLPPSRPAPAVLLPRRAARPLGEQGTILVEIAIEAAHAAVGHQPQPIRHQLDKMRIMRDQHHSAGKIGQRLHQRLAGIDVEMVGRFVQDQHLRRLPRREREQQAGLLAARQRGHTGLGAVGIETEAGKLGAVHRHAGTRQGSRHVGEWRRRHVQRLALVLREIPDLEPGRPAELARQRRQAAGQKPRERGFAVAVGAEQRDAVVHVEPQRNVPQHRPAVIARVDPFECEHRRGEHGGGWELEPGRRVLDHRLDLRQPRQRLQPRLGLACLGRLGAEPVDEGLDARPLDGDTLGGTALLGGALGADADELAVAALGQAQLAAIEEGDGFDGAVEQAAIVGDDDGGAGEAGQPALQPHRRLEIEVVGRLVEQQQVRRGEQGGGQRDAHPPAAGELPHRAGLRRRVEAEPGQDRGCPGRRGIGADHPQPLMNLRQPRGRGTVRLGEQRQTLGVGRQHRLQQAQRPVRRFLTDGADPGARGEPDFAPIGRDLAQNGAQQGRFPGAIAPDQADPLAGGDGQIGVIEKQPAAEAQRQAGDHEQAHGAGM